MMRTPLAVVALAAATSAQVSLLHLGTVDVTSTAGLNNPEYIGNNPSAIAWNGTDLWVGGFNSSGGPGDAAIVRVIAPALDPNTPTVPAAAGYGARFGVQSATPNSRGYSGLDLDGGLLVAAYDSGASSPGGITGWDLNGNNLWSKDARGSSGVAVDPGFAGVDAGTGWTTFGSSNRALQDSVTGADVYVTQSGLPNSGMDVTSGAGLFWRDMDFDATTGDIYLRKGNQVHSCLRIGGNQCVLNAQLSNATQADFVNIQNLAFVRQATDQVIFWNDRAATNTGQQFEDVIRCMRVDGTDIGIEWNGFLAPTGSGAYDFSYDEATSTLAICDFSARAVHVFAVSTYLAYGSGCPGQGGFVPQLIGGGDSRPNGTLDFFAVDTAPLSIGLFAFGTGQASTPLPFPGNCPVHLQQVVATVGAFVTPAGGPGSGTGSFSFPLPGNATGFTMSVQAFVLENGSTDQIRSSNGLSVTLQ